MTIDPLVLKWSAHFAGKSKLFPLYVMSIIVAEGGMGRIVAAVQKSQPLVTTQDEAVADTCRSLVHRMADDPTADPRERLAYLGGFWAPIGVENDPRGLNVNWVPNAVDTFDALRASAEAGV